MPTKEIQPPPLPPRVENGGQHLHAKIGANNQQTLIYTNNLTAPQDRMESQSACEIGWGRDRSIATSPGHWPPSASITARSQTAFAGCWDALGRMNPPSSTSRASSAQGPTRAG